MYDYYRMNNNFMDYSYANNYNLNKNIKDYGKDAIALNLDQITKQNTNFRTALWTGDYFQITLMSLKVGESIGVEVHENLDQMVYIVEGQGVVMIGDNKEMFSLKEILSNGYAFVIPAGKYHNLVNTGSIPLKLFSVYAPPEHNKGTIHTTKEMAELEEHHNK